jgi:hypothetical protein
MIAIKLGRICFNLGSTLKQNHWGWRRMSATNFGVFAGNILSIAYYGKDSWREMKIARSKRPADTSKAELERLRAKIKEACDYADRYGWNHPSLCEALAMLHPEVYPKPIDRVISDLAA